MSLEHLAVFAETFADLADAKVMKGARAVSGWLIDTSALASLARSPDAVEWAVRIERGRVRICTVTRLEVGYAAKTGADLRTAAHPLHRRRSSTKPPAIEDRAVAV